MQNALAEDDTVSSHIYRRAVSSVAFAMECFACEYLSSNDAWTWTEYVHAM